VKNLGKNPVTEKFEACKTCGACFKTCEAYKTYNPKTIKKLADTLNKNTLSINDAHLAYRCNLCGHCQTKCPEGLNLAELFKEARIAYCKSGQGPLSYHTPMLTNKKINFFTLNNNTLMKPKYPKQADRIFFPGCALRTFRPELIEKVKTFLGDVLVLNQDCCGKSFRGIGLEDEYQTHNNALIRFLESFKPKEIIVACPNCYTSFKPKIDFAKVVFAQEALLQTGKLKPVTTDLGTIAVHDSCPFKEAPELFNIARRFVDTVYTGQRVEFINSKEKLRCCGGGGGVSFSNEKLSKHISSVRLREAKATSADTVVTFCVSCAIQLGSVAAKEGICVFHSLDLLEPVSNPDYGIVYHRSRKQFSGSKLFVNLMRLQLQV
jgi:Fe-S oxidoreductase